MHFTLSNLQDEHAELLACAAHLHEYMDVERLRTRGEQAACLLHQLAQTALRHFMIEETLLYREMLDSRHLATREETRRILESRSDTATQVRNLLNDWGTPKRIEADPHAFVAAVEHVLQELVERIGAEESELYPLFQQLLNRST